MPGRYIDSQVSRGRPRTFSCLSVKDLFTPVGVRNLSEPKGGPGGDALVEGDASTAEGGDGGEAVRGPGGRGGRATVRGNNSFAKGGKGGRGGIVAGMDGTDADVAGDNQGAIGGNGGEAPQADGRGGRGASSTDEEFLQLLKQLGVPESIRPHLKQPYGAPNLIPGRGGDGADSVQYKARRIIIEDLKCQFFRQRGIAERDEFHIWYDRETVSLGWLNDQLVKLGHRWRVELVDEEYQFADTDELTE